MSRSGRMALVLTSFAAFMACGGGGDQQAQTKADEEQAPTGQQAQATEQAQRPVKEVSVTLSPKNKSGIYGEAVIGLRGDSIQVRLMLKGLESGLSHAAHLHEGTCEAGGGVAAALSSVSNSGNEMGTSRTTIDVTAVSPDASYFLQAHLPDGTPAACGNVPAGAFGASSGM